MATGRIHHWPNRMLNRHLLAYLPVYLGQALVGFGSVIVFTRLLSADEYGRYMLVLTGSALVSTLVFTWLDAAVARYHARSNSRRRLSGHLFTAFRLYVLLATPLTLAGALTLWLVDMPLALKSACAFALAHTVLRAGLMIALETRRAAGQAWRYSGLESFTLAGGFGFGVALTVFTDLGAAGPLAGLALASGLAALIDLPVLLKSARKDRANTSRSRAFLAYGGPVAFSLVFELLLTSGDRFLIAAYLGESATGAYAAGYAVSDRSLSILFHWLGMTAGPLMIAALEHEGKQAVRDVARRSAALMGALGFPAALGLALVASPLAALMIGEDLAPQAASIIPLIAAAGLMNGIMTHYFHAAYTLGRRTGVMAMLMTGFAVLNLILNAVLIPIWGLMGAAWATVIAYGLALIACAVHGRQIFALPIPVLEWAKAALGCLVMAQGVLLVPEFETPALQLIIKAITGAALYGSVMLALDGLGCRRWIAGKLKTRLARGAVS